MKKNIRTELGEIVFDCVNILVNLFLMLIILLPLLSILFSTVSDPVEVMKQEGLMLYPKGFNLGAYRAVLKNPNILSGYMNTIFIVIAGTTINILLSLIGAYVLSRKGTVWVWPLTMLLIFTMYFSGGTIPFYLTVRTVGLDGSLWALILPTAISTFNLIIMRTAMAAVPDSLPESAMIDGASHFKTLFFIMVPLTKATVAVLVLYYAVGHWNSWFNAMIFLRNKKLFPLQLILREILIQDNTSSMTSENLMDLGFVAETIKYATIVVATAPILCIYPVLQRYFVKGVMIGAVKG